MTLPNGRALTVRSTVSLSILDDCWFPRFGVSLPSQTLCAQWEPDGQGEMVTVFEWGEP